MANTPTSTRTRRAEPADDAPDLTPSTPDETPADEAAQGVPGTVTMSDEAFREAIANAAAQAAEDAVAAMARERSAAPVEATLVAASPAPVAVGTPPDEPTYEPAFIPTPEDFAAADEADAKGLPYDEPVARAATILVNGPQGDTVECTPKVFRMILAPLGYAAHPEDAAQLQHAPAVRRRRGAEDAPSSAAARRRRRQ